jgi:hypothetical protein
MRTVQMPLAKSRSSRERISTYSRILISGGNKHKSGTSPFHEEPQEREKGGGVREQPDPLLQDTQQKASYS